MKLNVMFTVAAILMILVGLLSLFGPSTLVGTNSSAGFKAKVGGALALAFGVMAWLVRNDGPSKTRDSVVMGYTLLFVIWAAVSAYGIFLVDMPNHNISWVAALIQALLAIGFFMTGRASMSTSAS